MLPDRGLKGWFWFRFRGRFRLLDYRSQYPAPVAVEFLPVRFLVVSIGVHHIELAHVSLASLIPRMGLLSPT
jgi:hypothetical protein